MCHFTEAIRNALTLLKVILVKIIKDSLNTGLSFVYII